MTDLMRLRELFALKRLARASSGRVEGAQLEESLVVEHQAFVPDAPHLIRLDGAARRAYAEALARLGSSAPVPEAIDASGAGSTDAGDHVILIAADQTNGDFLSVERAQYAPLLAAVSGPLVAAFTVHEALVGRVRIDRACVPFRMEVELDTPANSVATLRAVRSAIEEVSPSDRAGVRAVTRAAVLLRERLGPLARYPRSVERIVSATTREVVTQEERGQTFHLCDPEMGKTGAITFGDAPGPGAILADDRAAAVSLLLDLGLLAPAAELGRRVLQHLAAGDIRDALADTIHAIERHDEHERRWLLRDLPPLMQSLVARPMARPVIQTLWARLSPLRFARLYHHPAALRAWWAVASADERDTFVSHVATLIRPLHGRSPGGDHVIRTAS